MTGSLMSTVPSFASMGTDRSLGGLGREDVLDREESGARGQAAGQIAAMAVMAARDMVVRVYYFSVMITYVMGPEIGKPRLT